MRRHSIVILSSVLALSTLFGARSAHAALRVVATVPDLAAIAADIGGDNVQVSALSLASQDPHFVDPKPSYALALNRADLLLAVGLDLELGWLPALQQGARNAAVQKNGRGYLECSGFVTPLEVPSGKVDRSMGDIHPLGNPHYLFDPRSAAACARAIAARLGELDSAHADEYQAHLDSFIKRLHAAQAQWEKRLARYRGTPVVAYHRSWAYLLAWLDLVEVVNLEPKPGIAPSPRHVAQVIAIARDKGAKLLIQEAYYPSKTGTLVAQKIGGRVLRIPAATEFEDGQSYIDHMEEVVGMLEHGLKQ